MDKNIFSFSAYFYKKNGMVWENDMHGHDYNLLNVNGCR